IREPSLASDTSLVTWIGEYCRRSAAASVPARALLSCATWLAVQGVVFPAAADVQRTLPSGPGRTWILFLMLLRLVLAALDCSCTAVKAARPNSVKAIVNFFILKSPVFPILLRYRIVFSPVLFLDRILHGTLFLRRSRYPDDLRMSGQYRRLGHLDLARKVQPALRV